MHEPSARVRVRVSRIRVRVRVRDRVRVRVRVSNRAVGTDGVLVDAGGVRAEHEQQTALGVARAG